MTSSESRSPAPAARRRNRRGAVLGLALMALVACLSISAASAAAATSTWTNYGFTAKPDNHFSLESVSCPAEKYCVGVGTGAIRGIWNGESWTTTEHGSNVLFDVSCTSTSNCMAVGGTPAPKSMALRWNGSSWTGMLVSEPPGVTGSNLTGVSCSGSICFAVGNAPNNIPWGTVYNGSSWSTQVLPPGMSGAPTDVSCLSATNCIIVGNATNGGGVIQPWAVRWNGTGYEVLKLAYVGAENVKIESVSCRGTSCEAVGWLYNDVNPAKKKPVAQLWNGTSWTLQSVPMVENSTSAALNDVSCNSGTCWAAGSYTIGGQIRPFSERFDAPPFGSSTWEADLPKYIEAAGTGEQTLKAISCYTAWKCMTTGFYVNSTGGWAMSEYVKRS
jgi:hypothetical protein